MARYRNEDNVCMMFDRFFNMCQTKEQKTLVLDMKQAFLEIKTADVVPKSEVEKWKEINEQLHKEMSERILEERKIERKLVAREIFVEIDKLISSTEYTPQTRRKTIEVKELKEQVDWVLHEGVPQLIAELKKKYTESEGKV